MQLLFGVLILKQFEYVNTKMSSFKTPMSFRVKIKGLLSKIVI